MGTYFETKDLSVGYSGKVLIHDINVQIEKGRILSLIGPNGAGKSTILKSVTRHLAPIGGAVTIGSREIRSWSPREMARQVAVVLTERIRPELMTCAEVVAMGRYPYTGALGKLGPEDEEKVYKALCRVRALDLRDRDYMTLSDGQKQRILLARALCQEPQVLVLDEPTAYLDIRHKVELLDILRDMAREKQITVILSLHEIDLDAKVSDYLMLIRGDRIGGFGTPSQVLGEGTVEQLYDLPPGGYDLLFGSVELKRPEGEPQAFVVAGAGRGIPCYRALQRRGIPFATGILWENDGDFRVARQLAAKTVSVAPFQYIRQEDYEKAAEILQKCSWVLDAGTPEGPLNPWGRQLLDLAENLQIPVKTADQIL